MIEIGYTGAQFQGNIFFQMILAKFLASSVISCCSELGRKGSCCVMVDNGNDLVLLVPNDQGWNWGSLKSFMKLRSGTFVVWRGLWGETGLARNILTS